MEYLGSSSYEPDIIEYTAGFCKGFVYRTQEELAETTYVGFYIPKLLPFMDSSNGPIEKNITIDKSIFANSSDLSSISTTVNTLNYIKVKYNGRSNFSQPLIALGETAQIFFDNGDYKEPRYFDMQNDETKRKTDVLKFYVQAKDNVNEDGSDWYYLLLDSVNKNINIHSSNKNGEAHTYDIIIDTNNSKLQLNDDKNNQIIISSEDKEIILSNESSSSIDIKDKDIAITCNGDYSVSCKNYSIDAKSSISNTAKTKIEESAPKISLSANATLDCKTAMMNCNVSAKFACTAPMALFSGVVGAPSIGVCSSPGSPPGTQVSTSSMSILSSSPSDTAAQGSRTMAAILALIPFTTLPNIASGVVSGLAAQIPKSTVKI